jgi:hypothetical protein
MQGLPRRLSQTRDLIMVHNKKSAPTFRNEQISSESMRFLARDEPRAPTTSLSAAERAALIACLADGTLCKQRGVWTSPRNTNRRIASITVANLSRDGMLTVNTFGRRGVARLTARGSWFARTIASACADTDKANSTPSKVEERVQDLLRF